MVSYSATTFTDSEGKLKGVFAAAVDISDQKRLQDDLRQAQNYTRGLRESSVDAMMTVDSDMSIIDVNDQMARLSGYGRDQLIGSSFHDYFMEPDRAIASARQTLREGSIANHELTLRSRQRRRIQVLFNASVYADTEGRQLGIHAIVRDVTEQRRLQQELREARHYNLGLMESSVDALMTVAPDGTITDLNEHMVGLSGHSRRSLIGSRLEGYFTDSERAAAGVKQAFDDEVVTDYELVVQARSGRKLPVSFNAAVYRDTDRQVTGILVGVRDISTRKRIEEELREQQTYTRGLIESNIDALMTTDTLGVITDVNRQMCAVTGRGREELIGTPFKEYFTDPKRAEDVVRQVLSDGRVTNYELTIRAADGATTLVSYNATTFTGADGRLRGVFAAARDITDQQRLQEQIGQQNRELTETTIFMNTILESATESSIVAMDRDGLILAWNEGARRNYGYSAEEMVGKANYRILHAPDAITSGKMQELFDTANRTGKAEGVIDRVRKNGERFPASVAKTLRLDADGNPIGYVLISKDITEQKKLEQEIQRKNEELEEQSERVQEANRMKSEFLANMSHELRTPLNGIIGFSELLYDRRVGELAPQQEEFVSLILKSSRHLLMLINDVLDLAKVESGKFDFQPELVDLPKLLGEVTGVLLSLVAQKQLRVETQVDALIGEIMVDPAKLKQVIYNYFSNAIKFTPDAGRVWIRVSAEGSEHFRIEIEDTGIGIKPEDVSRLFVEFQQLDASTAKKHQGTGLGLALTKRIVEAQGGQIGVRSDPGKGSTFFAVLPRVSHPTASDEVGTGKIENVSEQDDAPVILVVEDDATTRSWLAGELSGAGYRVHTASTGAKAVAIVQNENIDLVTLDIVLPDMSGWDVLRSIRGGDRNSDVPVVVVSAARGPFGSSNVSVSECLTKPVSSVELHAALGRAGLSPVLRSTILVVDDDEITLRYLEQSLAHLGYQANCMSDGESALKIAAATPPDAVVLDLLMPRVDGFTFLDRFRNTAGCESVPVLVWTSKDLTPEEGHRLRASAQAVISKGTGEPRALFSALHRYIREPIARRKMDARPPRNGQTDGG